MGPAFSIHYTHLIIKYAYTEILTIKRDHEVWNISYKCYENQLSICVVVSSSRSSFLASFGRLNLTQLPNLEKEMEVWYNGETAN